MILLHLEFTLPLLSFLLLSNKIPFFSSQQPSSHLRALQAENYHSRLHTPLSVTDSHSLAPFNMATRSGMLDEIDAATAALSLCPQLQDIKDLAPNFQGNDSSGNTSNEEVAFRSYKSELESRICAYQCVAYHFSREVQETMSLAMTGTPLPAAPLPRATLAVAPTCVVAASTVVSTETPLAAEAAGSVTPPPAAASSQTSSPVSRSLSTYSAESSHANTLSDSADAKVSDQEQNTVSPVIVPRPTYILWSLVK
jgi:hypothetical protein